MLGNGQVVLILNPVQLVHRDSLVAAYVAVPRAEEAALVVEQKSRQRRW